MPTITFDSKSYPLSDGETVLDGLTRHGVSVPHSCKAGACQSCLMRVTAGAPPAAAQQGLKDALKAQGFFLACSAKPTGDLTVAPADGVIAKAKARVHRIDRLSHDVARVVLACDGPFDYRGGQFVNLVRPADGLTRSYSLASLHHRDEHLELHVRRIAGGAMSTWLHEEAAEGEPVEVRGPAGECFYVPGSPDQPIALIGTGTGLAPLYAIAQDALHHGHAGPIRLYHGAPGPAGLYLIPELTDLARRHPNFMYVRCVLNGQAGGAGGADPADVRVGNLEQVVLGDVRSFAGWRVFLCGHPALVQSLRKKVFLAGAKMKDISADAFVMRASA